MTAPAPRPAGRGASVDHHSGPSSSGTSIAATTFMSASNPKNSRTRSVSPPAAAQTVLCRARTWACTTPRTVGVVHRHADGLDDDQRDLPPVGDLPVDLAHDRQALIGTGGARHVGERAGDRVEGGVNHRDKQRALAAEQPHDIRL